MPQSEPTLASVIAAIERDIAQQKEEEAHGGTLAVGYKSLEVCWLPLLYALRAAIQARRDEYKHWTNTETWDALTQVLGTAADSAMAELEHIAQTLDYTQRGAVAELTDNDAEALKDLDIFRRRANSIELGTAAQQPGQEETR